jgi:acetylglutamate kinase
MWLKSINVAFLRHLLSGDISGRHPGEPGARASLGAALNVQRDDAAAALRHRSNGTASSPTSGVMRDGVVIRELTPDAALALMADGTAVGGMHAKLHAGLAALAGGVPMVRISDIAAIADPTRGTVLRTITGLS